MKTHMDLDVWKHSIDFVEKVYNNSRLFPKEEVYGLTSQIRRALYLSRVISPKVHPVTVQKNLYNFFMWH